jgi:hypothetical protein
LRPMPNSKRAAAKSRAAVITNWRVVSQFIVAGSQLYAR